MEKKFVGIDIGGTFLKGVVVELDECKDFDNLPQIVFESKGLKFPVGWGMALQGMISNSH